MVVAWEFSVKLEIQFNEFVYLFGSYGFLFEFKPLRYNRAMLLEARPYVTHSPLEGCVYCGCFNVEKWYSAVLHREEYLIVIPAISSCGTSPHQPPVANSLRYFVQASIWLHGQDIGQQDMLKVVPRTGCVCGSGIYGRERLPKLGRKCTKVKRSDRRATKGLLRRGWGE